MLLAQEEARRMRQQDIGTEHLLLGLIVEGESLGARVLRSLNISYDAVRQRTEEVTRPSKREPPSHLPLNRDMKEALKSAEREAAILHQDFIGTEHLLLGLLRQEKGGGARILREMRVEAPRVRAALERLAAGESEEDVEAPMIREAWSRLVETQDASSAMEDVRPRCPVCAVELGPGGRTRTMSFEAPDISGDARAIVLAFCGRCGRTLAVSIPGT
jgi:ATP-dependent Clp protease ATP-binding subunit ClpA